MIQPLRVAIHNRTRYQTLVVETNWRINTSGSTYTLYSTFNFQGSGKSVGIPKGGDVFGLVNQVRNRAMLESSGVTEITVSTHKISIFFSRACAPESIRDLFMAALRTCGLNHEIVSETSSVA